MSTVDGKITVDVGLGNWKQVDVALKDFDDSLASLDTTMVQAAVDGLMKEIDKGLFTGPSLPTTIDVRVPLRYTPKGRSVTLYVEPKPLPEQEIEIPQGVRLIRLED